VRALKAHAWTPWDFFTPLLISFKVHFWNITGPRPGTLMYNVPRAQAPRLYSLICNVMKPDLPLLAVSRTPCCPLSA
jgi:hypothetical protein